MVLGSAWARKVFGEGQRHTQALSQAGVCLGLWGFPTAAVQYSMVSPFVFSPRVGKEANYLSNPQIIFLRHGRPILLETQCQMLGCARDFANVGCMSL